MAFDAVKEYQRQTTRANMTTASAAAATTEASAYQARDIVIDFTRQASVAEPQNDPNNPNANGANNPYGISNEELEKAVNSQLKKARTVATIGAIGMGAGVLGTLLSGGQLGGVSQTGSFNIGDFFNKSGGNNNINLNGNNQYVQLGNTNTNTALTTTLASIGVTNQLDKALADYKQEATAANWDALNTQIAQANNDLGKIVSFKNAKRGELTNKEGEYKTAEGEMKELEGKNKELRKQVDAKYEAMQAYKQIGLLKKENETQEGIIKQCGIDIGNKRTETQGKVSRLNLDIQNFEMEKSMAVKIEASFVDGKMTTKTVPDEEMLRAIEQKITQARGEIERLNKEFDEFEREELKKKNAAAEIIKNNIAKIENELQPIVDKSEGGAEGIEKLSTDFNASLTALNNKQTQLNDLKTEINGINTTLSSVESYESRLKRLIGQGQSAATKKPNIN